VSQFDRLEDREEGDEDEREEEGEGEREKEAAVKDQIA
jgi:hypothetical protein